MTERYRIVVEGHVDGRRWAEWLGDSMEITALPDGRSSLVGGVADQSALHGIIGRIRDMGLTLVSLERR